jgi:hypothetical protein
MQASLHLTYTPAPGGAVTLAIASGSPGPPLVTLTWDHSQALDAAAPILAAAGVTQAEFAGDRLHPAGPSACPPGVS